jgi:CheY-like chemotaxis protein
VSAPHLLLVDDSEAVLAFERTLLGGTYVLTTATNGRDALQKARQRPPDCVLLDLSMPELSGDELLELLRADPELREVPVIVVSSERERAEACLTKGAQAYVPKPILGGELKDTVAEVLARRQRERRAATWVVLAVEIGPATLALPLSCVQQVLLQPATEVLQTGPSYLRDVVNLHGQPVMVLNLAGPLRVESALPLQERKLLVIEHQGLTLALGVDKVRDPAEFPPEAVTVRDQLVGAQSRLVASGLTALIRTPSGMLPVVDPGAFFSRRLVQGLRRLVEVREEAAVV